MNLLSFFFLKLNLSYNVTYSSKLPPSALNIAFVLSGSHHGKSSQNIPRDNANQPPVDPKAIYMEHTPSKPSTVTCYCHKVEDKQNNCPNRTPKPQKVLKSVASQIQPVLLHVFCLMGVVTSAQFVPKLVLWIVPHHHGQEIYHH